MAVRAGADMAPGERPTTETNPDRRIGKLDRRLAFI